MKNSKKFKIFIACDTNKIAQVKKIIKHTKSNRLIIGYKFGLEFLNSKNGRSFVSKIKIRQDPFENRTTRSFLEP